MYELFEVFFEVGQNCYECVGVCSYVEEQFLVGLVDEMWQQNEMCGGVDWQEFGEFLKEIQN